MTEVSAKHDAKVVAASATTLQDLPVEVLDRILLKAVVKEVRELKLAKCTWNRETLRIVKRLRPVWSQWNYSLTTRWFRIVLQRTLSRLNPAPVRIEIVEKHWIHGATAVTTMNNEVLVLCSLSKRYYVINIYKRNNLSEIVSSINLPLPLYNPTEMKFCRLTNCIYIVCTERHAYHVIQHKKEDDFKQISWGNAHVDRFELSFSNDGDILIPEYAGGRYVICLCKYCDILQDSVTAPEDTEYISHPKQKSNGNFVYFWSTDSSNHFVEIDKHGNTVHKYVGNNNGVHVYRYIVDKFDRIVIGDDRSVVGILDSEFNMLSFISPDEDLWNFRCPSRVDDHWTFRCALHYDRDMNEMFVSHNQCLTVATLRE